MPARAASGADSAAQRTRLSPCTARAFGDGDRPGDGADATVERELSDDRMVDEPLGRQLP